jgi:hypothetical protein
MATIATGLGALIFGKKKAFGGKPEVPDLPQIDPSQIQSATIAANAQDLPAAQNIAASQNAFNFQQQLGQLQKALEFLAPGQLQQVQANNASLLRGEVPQDVQQQLQRQSVAGAYGRGYGPGSGIAQNDYLRNFGLTSLQLQQQGQAGFGALASMAPKTPLYDATSMFFTPQQRLEFAFKQNENNFNREWLQNQVDAAPDPFASAFTQALIHDENEILKTVSSVAGMAGGAVCWVARAVLGTADKRWEWFRVWLLTEAPAAFRAVYLRHGQQVAARLTHADKQRLRPIFNHIALTTAYRYA